MNPLSENTSEIDEEWEALKESMFNNPQAIASGRRYAEEYLRKKLPKELPWLIRELFRDGSPRTPEKAIRGIKQEICRRLTPKHRKAIQSGLLTAVRRGILKRQNGDYVIANRRFSDYDDAFLETRLLAALGRNRCKRSEAPRLLARWLGFYVTSAPIKETTKRLIRRLVRTGRINAEGRDWIRRA